MRNIFFALLFLPLLCAGQSGAIQKTIGFTYTAGVPTFIPSPVAKSSEIAQDTTTKDIYFWNRYTQTWDKQGRGYDEIPGALAPLYTPTYTDSKLVINAANELYRWRSGVTWDCINCVATIVTTARLSGNGSAGSPLDIAQQGASAGQVLKWTGSTWQPGSDNNTTYTAGSGISINGSNVIANTLPDQTVVITGATGTYPNFTLPDQSATNELNTGFDISGGNLRVIDAGATRTVALTSIAPVQSVTGGTGITVYGTNALTITNTSPDQTVSITGAGINAVTGTYPNFTVTGTEVDSSITNELQTITNTSDATSHTVTLSNTGGSIKFVEGANTTFTTTGTTADAVVTIASTGGGIASLNGLTGSTQTFAIGSAGTDANVSSTGTAHTFNFPTASSTNRGLLGTTDWTAFNAKIGGSGAANQIPYFTGASTLAGYSKFVYNPANNRVGVGTATPGGRFTIKDDNHTGNYIFECHADDASPWVAGFFNDTYNSASPAFEYFARNTGDFEMGTQVGKSLTIYQGYGFNKLQIGTSGDFINYGDWTMRGGSATNASYALSVQNSAATNLFRVTNAGAVVLYATNTAAGTTGSQTINKPSGTVNFAAGATSLTVTSSLCTTSSIIMAMPRTNDATAQVKNVVPASGSFTINLTAAATAETSVGFWFIN